MEFYCLNLAIVFAALRCGVDCFYSGFCGFGFRIWVVTICLFWMLGWCVCGLVVWRFVWIGGFEFLCCLRVSRFGLVVFLGLWVVFGRLFVMRSGSGGLIMFMAVYVVMVLFIVC